MNIWTVLISFLKINYLIDVSFLVLLKDAYISEKDYMKPDNIWNVFKMNTMGDYHDLYLKTCFIISQCA